jgi:hypothetical protein
MASNNDVENNEDSLNQMLLVLLKYAMQLKRQENEEEGDKKHENIKCNICKATNFRGYRY